MGLIDLFKKASVPEVPATPDEEGDKSKTAVGTGIVMEGSIGASATEAHAKFKRPDYTPQTRRDCYDDGRAHKAALDQKFSSGEPVRDPYSGAELVKKQSDAKMQFGQDWQSHAAEADHIDPLSQIAKRTKENPFLTTEDVREIGNNSDNFQVLSRKENQSSSMGKGGKTQEEWAADDAAMGEFSKHIESGESIDTVRKDIRRQGRAAERRNNARLFGRSVKNAAETFHQAGTAGAQNAAITAATMSAAMNIVAVIKGEKSTEEALADIVQTGGKAAVTGYTVCGGMTVVSQSLSNSSSKFIQALLKSNVPGKAITAIMITGDTIKKWGTGEITTQECLLQLGEKGICTAVAGYSMVVGQALIPIPIVGGAIGALVGSILADNCCGQLMAALQKKELEHQERLRLIEEYERVTQQARAFREELEAYLNSYFKEYRDCFDEALSTIRTAYQTGNADGIIAGSNQITRKLGGRVCYDTVSEFRDFLLSDSTDTF